MNQESETSKIDVNTGGGAFVGGNMNNEGKFVGRDNTENNINILLQKDNFKYAVLLALVGIILAVPAMYFFYSRNAVPPNTPTEVSPPTLQATDTLASPTQTPSATPTDAPSPTPELTATSAPKLTIAETGCTAINTLPLSECEALVALYTQIDIPNPDNNPCNWPGVTCDGGHVTQLYIASQQLSVLPSEIGLLSNLEVLYLHDNKLSTLPSELWSLPNLENLDLSDNQLRTLPAEVSQLYTLVELSLSKNRLESLPPEIDALSRLSLLNLSRLRLSELPVQLGNLFSLETLYLNENQLHTLPSSLTQLSNLANLDISQNRLHITDTALLDWMNKLDPDWAETQAVMMPTPTATNGPTTSAIEIPDAVAQVEINFCEEGLVSNSVIARKTILRTKAKLDAVQQLFSSQLTSENDTIIDELAGWVRVFGTPRYYDGEKADEYCVSFVAYITEEDRARATTNR